MIEKFVPPNVALNRRMHACKVNFTTVTEHRNAEERAAILCHVAELAGSRFKRVHDLRARLHRRFIRIGDSATSL